MKVHFSPVGKPAPPRPRSEEFLSSASSASGGMRVVRILRRAS